MKSVLFFLVFLGTICFGRDLSVLFIGNSYTYVPGTETDPGLPKNIKQITQSIEPALHFQYAFNTPGGWDVARHFNDPTSRKLMSQHYDQVIVQGQSIESLELTPWFHNIGMPDVASFGTYLPKMLDLLFQNNSNVALYVNWSWNTRHPFLQESHPGLLFPAETSKAGQKWCGADKYEYQEMIDESYQIHSVDYPVAFAWVGDTWLDLQENGMVNEDELYLLDDWSHPSDLGAFVTALVFVRDIFHLNILKNTFYPSGVNPIQGAAIANRLALRKQSTFQQGPKITD